MRFRCLACNYEFDSDEKEVRCPECLRINDIEPVKGDGGADPGRKKFLVPALLLILVIAGLAVYYFGVHEESATETAANADLAGPLSESDLQAALEKFSIPPDMIALPFAPGPEIEKLAEKAGGSGSDSSKMEALWQYIVSLRSSRSLLPHPQHTPRSVKPMTAGELADLLISGKEKPAVYSYESAALMLALARQQELAADMVEIHRLEGARTPADPSGRYGRYGVAFFPDRDRTSAPLIYDPYSGSGGKNFKPEYDRLGDLPATGAYYNLLAIYHLQAGDLREAQKVNTYAVHLAPDSASAHCVRAAIFAGSGAMHEALAELEKALKFRPDSPRRINLAELLLLTRPGHERAREEIEKALTDDPDMARAHALYAMYYISTAQSEKAYAQLAIAEKLEPDSPSTAAVFAQYHLQKGEVSLAVQKAEKAVKLTPDNLQAKLLLATVYLEAGRTADMKKVIKELLEEIKDNPSLASMIRRRFNISSTGDAGASSGQTESPGLDLGGGMQPAGKGDLKLNLDSDRGMPRHLRLGGENRPTGGGLKLQLGNEGQ